MTAQNAPDEGKDTREFASFIIDLPQTHNELGQKMKELIKSVRETGKAGALTLKLAVKLLPGTDTTLVVTPSVTLAKPKFELKSGVFFTDKQGNPQRNDPNQPGLFDESGVKEAHVDYATGEVKDVQ